MKIPDVKQAVVMQAALDKAKQMQSLYIYALRDNKSETYSPPSFFVNRAVAVRGFSEVAADKNNMVGRHPADFGIYELGTFDMTTGIITSHEQPHYIGLAIDLLAQGN